MTDDGPSELELPRGIALAWGVAADPQRGPKREMSVERIVDAAVEIADAEGLGAVSMGAVAARLGFTPMSLYRYVSAKDDLVLLMQEQATGVPPEALRGIEGWRPRLEALYRAMVELNARHPWMLEIPATGSPVTPNASAWMDALVEALDDTRLSAEERLSIALLVTGHARWNGAILAVHTNAARSDGVSPAELARREDAVFRALISPEEFPSLHRVVVTGAFATRADLFRFGLDRILDGIAVYLASAAAERPALPRAPAEPEPASVASDKRYREAQKAVRTAEKALRDARKLERIALRDARERASRNASSA